MTGNKEIRKLSIVVLSFVGLFFITKFSVIDPGTKNIPASFNGSSLNLSYGQRGVLKNNDVASLFWGSVDNENFQDIFYRLKFLVDLQVDMSKVTFYLHSNLFAQRRFNGLSLERVIPYYPNSAIVKRVFETGLSYEFIINFLKYKIGVPFRSTREISVLINNHFKGKERFPYFVKKVGHTDDVIDYVGNSHFFLHSIEMLVKKGIPVELVVDKKK